MNVKLEEQRETQGSAVQPVVEHVQLEETVRYSFTDEELRALVGLMETRAAQLAHDPAHVGKARRERYILACGEIGAELEPKLTAAELSGVLFAARGSWLNRGRARAVAERREAGGARGSAGGAVRRRGPAGPLVRVTKSLPPLFKVEVEQIEEPLEAKYARLEADVLVYLKKMEPGQRFVFDMQAEGLRAVEAKLLADHLWKGIEGLLKKVRWYKPKRDGSRVSIHRIDTTKIQVARHS